MADLNTEIKLTASADGVETGVARAKRSLADLGATAAKAGADGGKGMAPIGDGAEAAAKKVDSATRNMQASLQRQIAALEAGGTATRQYQESIAKLRGVDANAIKPLLDQLDAAKRKADGAGQGLLGLGSASGLLQGQLAVLAGSLTLGSMATFVLQINNGIDALNDIKDATGSTIENISALEDVAKRTGASMQVVESAMLKFNKVLFEGAGDKESNAAKALDAIGLSAKELSKIDPAEALRQTAVALAGFADDANKARLVQELFGKSVQEVAPFLKDLAEQGTLVAKVTSQQADEAEKFNKQLFAMQANIQEASRWLAGPMVKSINETAEAFRKGSAAGESFFETAWNRYKQNIQEFYNAKTLSDALMAGTQPYRTPRVATGTIRDEGAAIAEAVKSVDLSGLDKVIKKTKEVKDSFIEGADAAREWGKYTEQFIKAADSAESSLNGLTKTQGTLTEFLKSPAYLNMAEPARQVALEAAYAAIAVEQLGEATKAQAKAEEEAAKAMASIYDASVKNTAQLQASIESEYAAAAAVGLNAIAVAELEAAKLSEMATSKERQAVTMEGIDLSGESSKALRAEAKALRDLGDAKLNKARKEVATDEAKKASDEWKKAAEKIEQDLTDALMRGFESGKSMAMTLRDTVVNMFKTMVLRPIVSAIVSPVAGALTGMMGLSGAANAATGATGGTGLLSALGTGLGSGFSMIAGGGISGWLGASSSLIGTGTMAGGMAGLGALAGPIGAVLAIASLVKSLDNSGTFHAGGASSYSALAGGTAINPMTIGTASVVNSAQTQTMTDGMVKSIVDILDSTAITFGKEAGYQAATAFADDTSKDGAWGALVIKKGGQALVDWAADQVSRWAPKEFADGKAGAEQYAAAVSASVRDLLIQQTPEWADTMLSALGEAPSLEQLGQVVTQINATQAALITMGKASEAFAGLSEAATSSLITAMGGAGAAVENLGSYYANFYSEAERAAIETAALTESFASMGVTMPSTRDGLREMIDTALEMGDSQLAAGLINVSNRFAALVPAADKAAKAIDKAADGFYTFALFAPGGTTGAGGGGGINGPLFGGGAVAPANRSAMMMMFAEAATASQAGPITAAFEGIGANLGDKLQAIFAALTEQGIKIEDSPYLTSLRDIESQLFDTLQSVGGSISNAGLNDAGWEKWEQWQKRTKLPGYNASTDELAQQFGFVDRNTNNAAGSYGDLADFMSFILGRAGDWRNLVEIQDGAGRGTGSYRDPTQGEYGAIISADMYAFLKAQDTYTEALAELTKQMEEEAKNILDPLRADIAGKTEDPFKRISDQAAEYIKQLDNLGQATAENTALVEEWQKVMSQNIRDDLYSQLLTQEERRAADLRKLTSQFDALNVAVPESAEAFRKLLDGIDGTTPAGLALYDSLLQLIPGFQALQDAVKSTAETAEETARRLAAAQRNDRLTAQAEAVKKEAERAAELVKAYTDGAEAFTTLRDSLLKSGDAAGLLSSVLERIFADPSKTYTAGGQTNRIPVWEDYATAAQFNNAYGIMTARLRRDLSNDLSANALRVQNVGPAMQALSVANMFSRYDPVTGPMFQEFKSFLQSDLPDILSGSFDRVAQVMADSAVNGMYGSSGQGIAGIYAAQRGMALMAEGNRVYADTMRDLGWQMSSGSISAAEYAESIARLNEALPAAASVFGDVAAQAEQAAGAAYAMGKIGYDSIQYYFGQLGDIVTELAKAAEAAAEPIAKTTGAIGRFNSASTAFGLSARAAMMLGVGDSTGSGFGLAQALPDISRSALIAQAAAIAAELVTTADTAKVQETTGLSRDVALLIDGVRAYDAESLEKAFMRASNALATGTISEAEYSKLINTSFDVFQDIEAQNKELASTFDSLRKAAKSLADELLLDKGLSTLSGPQQLAEAQRQYRETLAKAFEGDSQAAQELGGVAKTMLGIAQGASSNGSDYARIFGSTVADARRLEAIQTPMVSALMGGESATVTELRALREEVAALRADQREGLAQVASGTNTTAKRLTEWTNNGLPATETV